MHIWNRPFRKVILWTERFHLLEQITSNKQSYLLDQTVNVFLHPRLFVLGDHSQYTNVPPYQCMEGNPNKYLVIFSQLNKGDSVPFSKSEGEGSTSTRFKEQTVSKSHDHTRDIVISPSNNYCYNAFERVFSRKFKTNSIARVWMRSARTFTSKPTQTKSQKSGWCLFYRCRIVYQHTILEYSGIWLHSPSFPHFCFHICFHICFCIYSHFTSITTPIFLRQFILNPSIFTKWDDGSHSGN